MQDIKRILPFLLERMDREALVFFVGAGIPASEAGLPDGSTLRRRLLKELGERRTDEKLPELAERFESERDRLSLYDFLRANLTFQGDVRENRYCSTYKMLLDLPIKTFITTNFDNLFESVAAAKGMPLEVFRTDGQLANYKPGERSLFKIHGDLDVAPDKIVITSADYDAYADRCPLFSHRITDVFHVNTVVFLGYNLSDPDLNNLYRRVLKSVGGLKKKSYAILMSDPGLKVREEWKKQKIEIVNSTAQDFVRQLYRQHKQRSTGAEKQRDKVKITSGRKFAPPRFYSLSAPIRARKAFAYFVARQKMLLKTEAYSFCTIDTLQTSGELLDPSRKIAQLISAKALEISIRLTGKGYYSDVLPPLDEIPERIRRRRIEEANLCIIFITSSTYETYLNRLYGAVASAKPILVFIHNNFHPRLKADLLFRGLLQAGADLSLFKSKEVASCALRGMLEQLLESRTDQWLARTLNI